VPTEAKFTPQQHLSMTLGTMDTDISPDFVYNEADARIGAMLINLDKTPQAFETFCAHAHELTDHAYWFYLGTLWVSYNGWTDLAEWRKRFLSGRRLRKTSLMKPSEVVAFERLPKRITVYRAHREGETDWMSYTLDPTIAARFARERGVDEITEHQLLKRDILALFLRRGEAEVLALWPKEARKIRMIDVIVP
jgi:hypothetical protein